MLLPLARRALAGAAVVAGVVALTFVLLRLAPGDPVEQLVGPAATPEQTALQRHALGLDRPLPRSSPPGSAGSHAAIGGAASRRDAECATCWVTPCPRRSSSPGCRWS